MQNKKNQNVWSISQNWINFEDKSFYTIRILFIPNVFEHRSIIIKYIEDIDYSNEKIGECDQTAATWKNAVFFYFQQQWANSAGLTYL